MTTSSTTGQSLFRRRSVRALTSAAAGAVAVGCLIGTPASASALSAPEADQATTRSVAAKAGGSSDAATNAVHIYEFIEARHSGKDLAVENDSTAAGAHIVQFTRNTGHNQQWEIKNLPSAPSVEFGPDRQIKNRKSGMCLDIQNNSTAAGALVVQNPCNTSDPAQRWYATKVAEIFTPNGGFRRLVNRNSGLVMDVSGASTANGAHVGQWPKHTGSNQLFQRVFADAESD